jgi:hypothetical protein
MESFKEFAEFVLKNSRHNEVPSDRVHIILNYPKIEWDEYAEYMATLTWFTSIGWSRGGSKSSHVIFAETLDDAMIHTEKYNYAIVSYIGTFYNNYQTNAPETIHTYFDKFCESNHPCRGHILWHPDKQYGRLHHQCMFLNIQNWRDIGKPKFGKWTGLAHIPERSETNVHDDYTPHWIKPSGKHKPVLNAEMSQYITAVLDSGQEIINFDLERDTKFFCYPERRHCDALDFERNRSSNIIYAKNNETLAQLNIRPKEKFDVIYAPAAGYSAEYLYHKVGHKDTKLVVFDNHKESLQWKKMLYEMVDAPSDIERVNRHFSRKGCIIDMCDYKPELVEKNEQVYSMYDWIKTMKSITPEIVEFDAVNDIFEVDPNKRNLIYLSNIFSYMFLIHLKDIGQIHDMFKKYCSLPNTTIYGKNVFKDTVLNENHRN